MKKKKATAKKAKTTKLKIKAVSVPRTAGEDVDGCDVAVTRATLDHELPAAKGGVA